MDYNFKDCEFYWLAISAYIGLLMNDQYYKGTVLDPYENHTYQAVNA